MDAVFVGTNFVVWNCIFELEFSVSNYSLYIRNFFDAFDCHYQIAICNEQITGL